MSENGEVRLSYHELHASAADCGVEALRYQTIMHNLNKYKRLPWVWLSLTYVERTARSGDRRGEAELSRAACFSCRLWSGSSKIPNTNAQFLNKCKRIPLGEAISYTGRETGETRRETGEVRPSYHELHASAADCGVEALRYQTLMHNFQINASGFPWVRLSYHELHASAADCGVEALRYQTLMHNFQIKSNGFSRVEAISYTCRETDAMKLRYSFFHKMQNGFPRVWLSLTHFERPERPLIASNFPLKSYGDHKSGAHSAISRGAARMRPAPSPLRERLIGPDRSGRPPQQTLSRCDVSSLSGEISSNRSYRGLMVITRSDHTTRLTPHQSALTLMGPHGAQSHCWRDLGDTRPDFNTDGSPLMNCYDMQITHAPLNLRVDDRPINCGSRIPDVVTMSERSLLYLALIWGRLRARPKTEISAVKYSNRTEIYIGFLYRFLYSER
ncbi:hypothetical protein J6590_061844 [Homalodisca vitripennis]|nr:hypothetical protein J6590_061844 [Homalodisca vitripennis]